MAHNILFSVVLCFVSYLEIKDDVFGDVLWQEGWDSHCLSPPTVNKTLTFPFSKQHLNTYWGVLRKAADIYKDTDSIVFFTKTKNNKGQGEIAVFHNEMHNNNTKLMFYQWDIAWTGIIIKHNNKT